MKNKKTIIKAILAFILLTIFLENWDNVKALIRSLF